MFYILILAIFCFLAIKAWNHKLPDAIEGDKSVSGADRCLYKMAAQLYSWFPFKKKNDNAVLRSLVQLSPEETPGYLKWKYSVKKIKVILLIVFAGDIVALLLWIGGGEEKNLVDGRYIFRKDTGEGNKEILLTAKRESGEEIDTRLVIQEQRYESEELEVMYAAMLEVVDRRALGENDSWDHVTGDLCFMDKVEGYPFCLYWRSDNAQVTWEGKIISEDEEAQPRLVSVQLRAEYHDFVREHMFYAKIYPRQEEMAFSELLVSTLQKSEEEAACEDRVILPTMINEEEVIWKEKQENKSGKIFALGLIGAIAAYVLMGREVQKQVQEKNRQMEAEYPVIISKLALYLGAGMNIKNTWEKIAEEGGEMNRRKEKSNPVYREMLFTCREMKSGISEAEAYERFGKRLHRQKYIRLTTLLVQNLKKGNAALLLQLRQETLAALEERASEVKREGEEMGTKLLLPMILIMGMVMVLIIVPAFLSF